MAGLACICQAMCLTVGSLCFPPKTFASLLYFLSLSSQQTGSTEHMKYQVGEQRTEVTWYEASTTGGNNVVRCSTYAQKLCPHYSRFTELMKYQRFALLSQGSSARQRTGLATLGCLEGVIGPDGANQVGSMKKCGGVRTLPRCFETWTTERSSGSLRKPPRKGRCSRN